MKQVSACLIMASISFMSCSQPSTHSDVTENAISTDIQTELKRVEDSEGNRYWVLLTNGLGLNQRNGYRIKCDTFSQTEDLIQAFGFSKNEIGDLTQTAIKADSVQIKDSGWKTNPILTCGYGNEAKLYVINYGTVENPKNKFFISFSGISSRFYNIGCVEPLKMMGFDIHSATPLNFDAHELIDKSDVYDINCQSGSDIVLEKPVKEIASWNNINIAEKFQFSLKGRQKWELGFKVQSGLSQYIRLETAGNSDSLLRLYKINGEEIVQIVKDDDSGYANGSRITGLFEPGEYKLVVLSMHEDSADSKKFTLYANKGCPEGYIRIPRNSTPNLGGFQNSQGVASFCAAKYEMKCSSEIKGENCGINERPISVARNEPWTNITHQQALEACANIGKGYGLISNGQWMAIARNVEEQAKNWSDGLVGSGVIASGHSDASPLKNLEANVKDELSYFLTGNGLQLPDLKEQWNQRRTFFLSNGEIIWDLSGNAWEWIKEKTTELEVSNVPNRSWGSFEELSFNARLFFGPRNKDYTAVKHGVGRYYYDLSKTRGVTRGGYYSNAGLYNIDFGYYAGPAYSYRGFRCVYQD